jgi:hypothetical protein
MSATELEYTEEQGNFSAECPRTPTLGNPVNRDSSGDASRVVYKNTAT